MVHVALATSSYVASYAYSLVDSSRPTRLDLGTLYRRSRYLDLVASRSSY